MKIEKTCKGSELQFETLTFLNKKKKKKKKKKTV